jgi:ABC-type molybdenum transport system ATPase subunit/photorepair protein PhrA
MLTCLGESAGHLKEKLIVNKGAGIQRHSQKLINMKLNSDDLSIAFKAHTNWHVITGTPSSGKTTFIDLLASRGYQIAPEAGRRYLEREIAGGRKLEEIRANDSTLAPIINQLQRDIENQLQHDQTIFLDRAYPDWRSFLQVARIRSQRDIIRMFLPLLCIRFSS